MHVHVPLVNSALESLQVQVDPPEATEELLEHQEHLLEPADEYLFAGQILQLVNSAPAAGLEYVPAGHTVQSVAALE